MRVLRILHSRRTVLSVGMISLLALASGCSDDNPVATVGETKGKEIGESRRTAREKAFGPGGVPSGKPAGAPAAPAAPPKAK